MNLHLVMTATGIERNILRIRIWFRIYAICLENIAHNWSTILELVELYWCDLCDCIEVCMCWLKLLEIHIFSLLLQQQKRNVSYKHRIESANVQPKPRQTESNCAIARFHCNRQFISLQWKRKRDLYDEHVNEFLFLCIRSANRARKCMKRKCSCTWWLWWHVCSLFGRLFYVYHG